MEKASVIKEEKIIYVLSLKEGKYYVGSTENLERRWAQHFSRKGSAWTKCYPPIEVVETKKGDGFDEDSLVLRYMCDFGIDNVRGGTYSKVDLDSTVRQEVERKIKHAYNKCMNCGKEGHFIRNCPELKTNGNSKDSDSVNFCTRCGRDDHSVSKCYASVDVEGRALSCSDSEGFFSDSEDSEVLNRCARCGRDNHDASNCFASTDINGQPLSSSCEPRRKPANKVLSSRSRKRPSKSPMCKKAASRPQTYSLVYTTSSRKSKNSNPIHHCTRCGRKNHDSSSCFASIGVDRKPLLNSFVTSQLNPSSQASRQRYTSKRASKKCGRLCIRCGRKSHTVDQCFASSDVNGNNL